MGDLDKVIQIKRNREVVAEYPVEELMNQEEWKTWKKFNNILNAFDQYRSYNRINELKELARKLPNVEELEKRALNDLY